MNDKIPERQKAILSLLSQKKGLSRSEVKKSLQFSVADVTLIRDLNALEAKGYVISDGKTKGKTYRINPAVAQWPVDMEKYFEKKADDRCLTPLLFRHDIFDTLHDILSGPEKEEMKSLSQKFAGRKHADDTDAGFRKELERVCIELSWKSSVIEGNTYTLLETEELILHHREAEGHEHTEAQMILNHKDAFSFILEHQEEYMDLKHNTLLHLHEILTKDLNVKRGFRSSLVGVTGTVYRPLENQWQIQEAVDKLIKSLFRITHAGERALVAHAMIAYIQPFADGNKRTGRMLGNAILIANDLVPLSYRSIDEKEYKKAMLLFYETNNIYHVKRLFLEQFRFAAENYF